MQANRRAPSRAFIKSRAAEEEDSLFKDHSPNPEPKNKCDEEIKETTNEAKDNSTKLNVDRAAFGKLLAKKLSKELLDRNEKKKESGDAQVKVEEKSKQDENLCSKVEDKPCQEEVNDLFDERNTPEVDQEISLDPKKVTIDEVDGPIATDNQDIFEEEATKPKDKETKLEVGSNSEPPPLPIGDTDDEDDLKMPASRGMIFPEDEDDDDDLFIPKSRRNLI